MASHTKRATVKEHYDHLREDIERRNEFDAELSLTGQIDYFRGTMCRRDDYNLRKTPAPIAIIMKKYMPFRDANFLENTMPSVPQTEPV